MFKKTFDRIRIYWIAIAVALIDQYMKHLVRANLPLRGSWNPFPWLAPYIQVTYITNTGAAFGLFKEWGNVLAIVSIVTIVAIIVYYGNLSARPWQLTLALGMQLGGAIGNLIDRLVFGAVTSFVDMHVWPVFSVADACIVVGVVTLAITLVREPKPSTK